MTERIMQGFPDEICREIDHESIQCALGMEHAICRMQEIQSRMLEPEKMGLMILQAAVEFYDADWCEIVDIDMDMKAWKPFWRYRSGVGPVAIPEYTVGIHFECLDSWIEAIRTHKILDLPEIETIRETNPEEYEVYRKYGIHSLLVQPYWMKGTGAVVIANPKRFKRHLGMLHLVSHTAVAAMADCRLMETMRHRTLPPQVKNEKDVYICVLGRLSITTDRGVISEEDLKSQKIIRLLAFLLTSSRSVISSRELQENIWPEEPCEQPGVKIKNLVYRLQQAFRVISDHRLIEYCSTGYRMNPNLNIVTDLQLFDEKYKMGMLADCVEKKKELYKEGMKLYRGDVLTSASSDHWLMPIAIDYQTRYIGMFSELMRIYDSERRYQVVQHHALQVRQVIPQNEDVYYWLIHGLMLGGSCEAARSELRNAMKNLTEEEYQDLVARLSREAQFQTCCPASVLSA